VLKEGTTRWQSTEDGLAMTDQSGNELELGCDTSRARRGEAWAQNGTRWREGVFMGALYRAERQWWGEEMAGQVVAVEN
jgi:hypothetical protein